MTKFWELLQASVIVQALITLILVITVCYLAATGQEVPELLAAALTFVLGFYFGNKVQQQIAKLQEEQNRWFSKYGGEVRRRSEKLRKE